MYIELSYPDFEKKFPQIAKDFRKMFPAEMLEDFKTDSDYVVRVGLEGVEIGYSSDRWHLVK